MATSCFAVNLALGKVNVPLAWIGRSNQAAKKRGLMRTIASLVCALFFALGASAQDAHKAVSKPVVVEIKNAEGESVGTATLTAAQHGVRIKLDVSHLPPGEHSLHIHQFAKCEAPDFKSAGPHFGGGHDHSGGLPAGDIPDFSLIVAADGTAHATVVAPNVTLGTDENSVFSNGGTAIVIHAVAIAASSAAPPRIACGVVTRPE
jgi:superoxide dismutase, Cu-Zn family